jgi:hypothetical protein
VTAVTDAEKGRVYDGLSIDHSCIFRGSRAPAVLATDRQIEMEGNMTRTLATFAVAASLAAGAVALPKEANATCFGCYVGAGVVGGLLLGAALASPPVYAAPPPVYVAPAPTVVYAAPAPPPCYWQTQRVWTGYNWAYQRARVCY